MEFWHNPRCSKSREALKLVEASGKPFRLRRYLEERPTRSELESLRAALGDVPVLEMVRVGEAPFKTLGTPTDAGELLDAMAEHPILIERPILIDGDRAVIGRPPERVREFL
ncbi:arsenate reductase (glutaredoxin) [Sulfitobacter sp. D35]|uniref:arsenate reductase (glutaredoxin) n=1 Tax=Sulfitobacter sp. D35 TaxID=3083252 RepID=UPI00296E8D00|nr:arsenate reductase (glutaredoxin) [Sulfitobacter sp. D35]MDW4498707.1 arsenate reductase (glutaredoxin) [Sulfitobacter sp. D35]